MTVGPSGDLLGGGALFSAPRRRSREAGFPGLEPGGPARR